MREPDAAVDSSGLSADVSSMPTYTAQVGHWSEELVDDVAGRVGESVDRELLLKTLLAAGREIELMSGRSFHGTRTSTSVFEPNGLPFVDVPDLRVGSIESARGVWEIPDAVDPTHATALQLVSFDPPARRAAPIGRALTIAGHLVTDAFRANALSGNYLVHGLGSLHPVERRKLLGRLAEPALRYHLPILATAVEGWWFQISRRLLWVTSAYEDEGRLVEPLLASEEQTLPLVAVEPILIVARMTQHPVDWALTARIWPPGVQQTVPRSWRTLARAVHGHGIPTITIDPESSPEETACQLVLKCYWHGYISGAEPAIAESIAAAYPQAVERVRRHTGSPSAASAAASLLEQLVHPGFDPAQGADATRRYVRRKSSIVILEHRKRENPNRYPWTQIGISERRFYKLLPQFAQKVNGRYQYDQDELVTEMRASLNSIERDRAVREAAMELLRTRGFTDASARKWLQRHRPEEAVDAWPRSARLKATA